MRRSGRAFAALLAVVVALDARAAGSPAEDKLYAAIAGDKSFKVRMQAIRVLTKSLVEGHAEASPEAIAALSKAATDDESYLVRGLACFSMGSLRDPRARAAVERALADVHPFVRAQAEHAMTLLPVRTATTTPPPQLPLERPALVVSVEMTPGLEVPATCVEKLKAALEGGFREKAAPVFAMAGEDAKRGFRLRGSIADRRIEPAEDGSTSVTIVVRVTIATWPENNLRHVISAKATSRSKTDRAAALEALERKLIEAAAVQAVLDVMAEINRS